MNKGMNAKTPGLDAWETPPELYAEWDAEFGFTLDPAATKENALCDVYYDEKANGLVQSWAGYTVFCNPPYNDAGLWVRKAVMEQKEGVTTVMLLPSRTEVSWFHDLILKSNAEIRFLKGRVRFRLGGKAWGSPRFGSMLIIWRGQLALPGLDSSRPVADRGGPPPVAEA